MDSYPREILANILISIQVYGGTTRSLRDAQDDSLLDLGKHI